MRPRRPDARRRGKILVFTAILLPGVILGGLAMSVDLGVVAVGRAQLSTATDAASLAGVRKLYGEFRLREGEDLSGPMATARSRSSGLALRNRVLGETLVMVDNEGNDVTGDVAVGHLDPNDKRDTLDPAPRPNATIRCRSSPTATATTAPTSPASSARSGGPTAGRWPSPAPPRRSSTTSPASRRSATGPASCRSCCRSPSTWRPGRR